jgi:hypothetical protein
LIFIKILVFWLGNLVGEGLESVEENEEYVFWSFLRIRIVGKSLGKF